MSSELRVPQEVRPDHDRDRQNKSLSNVSMWWFLELVNVLSYMAPPKIKVANRIKIAKQGNLRWGDYVRLSRWTQCNHKM